MYFIPLIRYFVFGELFRMQYICMYIFFADFSSCFESFVRKLKKVISNTEFPLLALRG